MDKRDTIYLQNVQQNNLKGFSLEIPKNKWTVITGVSGSGKSSLAFDIIHKEAQAQFFQNVSSYKLLLSGALKGADVEDLRGLSPSVAVAQKKIIDHPRSTVGTLSEIYDDLRLLFSRYAQQVLHLDLQRSHFSFNTQQGSCPQCNGLGVEDKISVDLLLDDPNKTIREGCFKIVNKDGYIIYSQVTMEALNEVCEANGFSVDYPWNAMKPDWQEVVLNGSDKIKILYGKHSLESRMKWTGIKAKPREKEFYKGILPVMNQILRKDRNPNILKYATIEPCSLCEGQRLNAEALSVRIGGKNIQEWAGLPFSDLELSLKKQYSYLKEWHLESIADAIFSKLEPLQGMGLGYLSSSRPLSELSLGELQTIRLCQQMHSQLSGLIYVFDEPSVGVHDKEKQHLIRIFRHLVEKGNTLIVVEHDPLLISAADYLVEIGPKAGKEGGELIYSGSYKDYIKSSFKSLTKDFLLKKKCILRTSKKRISSEKASFFTIKNAQINHLKNIDVRFKLNAINAVCGVSGSGKSSLIMQTLMPLIEQTIKPETDSQQTTYLENAPFSTVRLIERAPIGKNARSTPATYTKVFDLIRKRFARQSKMQHLPFGTSDFSFNNKAGACPTCEGTGVLSLGMHYLGVLEQVCPQCKGLRYAEEILQVQIENKHIADVLQMSVAEALQFFEADASIKKSLALLKKVGLSYIKLGQASGTLSGGEAQRVRLAADLLKLKNDKRLIIFENPSAGLHISDLQYIVDVFDALVAQGHTLIVLEHRQELLTQTDWLVELGPSFGEQGGRLMYEGESALFFKEKRHRSWDKQEDEKMANLSVEANLNQTIKLRGVATHNLKNIDVDIPYNKHTLILGPSGSGKSSLAFDTLYAQANNCFVETYPSYFRQNARIKADIKYQSMDGLLPSIALRQSLKINDKRSTLATYSGIDKDMRLLFSRFAKVHCVKCSSPVSSTVCPFCGTEMPSVALSSAFSPNKSEGACPSCTGLGELLTLDLNALLLDVDKNIFEGAFVKQRFIGNLLSENEKEYALLQAVGAYYTFDFHQPFISLPQEAQRVLFEGCGKQVFDVEWHYKTKTDQGIYKYQSTWEGLNTLVLKEHYNQVNAGKKSNLLSVLKYDVCPVCLGKKLKPEYLSVFFEGFNIYDLQRCSIEQLSAFFSEIKETQPFYPVIQQILPKLEGLKALMLSYLSLDRKTESLSGGELQRLYFSKLLGSQLQGICYVLDEPSLGLHPEDVKLINRSINRMVANKNTLVCIEHNEQIIQEADYIIELGPAAGSEGGTLMFSGTKAAYMKKRGLEKKAKEMSFKHYSKLFSSYFDTTKYIEIEGANANNLKDIDVCFYHRALNVLTGRSGSGKTSLIRDVLLKSKSRAEACRSVGGLAVFEDCIWVDRQPDDAHTNSSLASLFSLFDDLKKHWKKGSTQVLAKQSLSYNSKASQCPDCKGSGRRIIQLDFMNDTRLLCDTCNGRRYQEAVLAYKYKGKNIAEILQMSVKEALSFFDDISPMLAKLQVLERIGLSYIPLGQPADWFSGGEWQRIKVVRRLQQAKNLNKKGENSPLLFLFDEASKGLSKSDLHYLFNLFSWLMEMGHSIIAIDHHPILIQQASHIVDLDEGRLLVQGSLQEVRAETASYTGRYI